MTKPIALSCSSAQSAGTLRARVAGRMVEIEVGPVDPPACIAARLRAAIDKARAPQPSDPVRDIMKLLDRIELPRAETYEDDDEGGVTLYDGTKIPIAWMPREVFDDLRKKRGQ